MCCPSEHRRPATTRFVTLLQASYQPLAVSLLLQLAATSEWIQGQQASPGWLLMWSHPLHTESIKHSCEELCRPFGWVAKATHE